MKEFTIRDDAAFKLRGTMRPCIKPDDLWCIEFTGEQYNDKGEMTNTSTYQFFLNNEHINRMVEGIKL